MGLPTEISPTDFLRPFEFFLVVLCPFIVRNKSSSGPPPHRFLLRVCRVLVFRVYLIYGVGHVVCHVRNACTVFLIGRGHRASLEYYSRVSIRALVMGTLRRFYDGAQVTRRAYSCGEGLNGIFLHVGLEVNSTYLIDFRGPRYVIRVVFVGDGKGILNSNATSELGSRVRVSVFLDRNVGGLGYRS